jgi:hypothetical protein
MPEDVARPLGGRRRAEATALPGWIKPQLTKLVDQPPDGSEWLHELKFDGYRMHARLDRGAVRLLTRTGLDWTPKYPAIAAAVASLPARQAYLADSVSSIFIALDILMARAVARGIMTSIASRAAVASPARPWPAGGFIRIDELPEDVVLGVPALRPGQACAR